MPQERILPITAGHRELTIKVNGETLPREFQLLSASIQAGANRLAFARLAFLETMSAAGEYPFDGAARIVHGAAVELIAGGSDDATTLFKGVVVRQAMRATQTSAPQLVIDCRHRAMRLTLGRRDACFVDQKDSDVIAAMLAAANIDGAIDETTVTHPQLVQCRTSDWDFMLARAAANGLVIFPDGDGLAVRKPSSDASPVCTLTLGASLIECELEVDARRQYASVVGITWDPAQQALVEAEAVEPTFVSPGSLTGEDLASAAGGERLQLRHGAMAETEAQAWADGARLRSRVDMVSGRGCCEGIGSVHPGDVVTLAGVGPRFSGNVLVTAVRHDFDGLRGWKTHLQFGGLEATQPSTEGLAAPGAGGLVGRITGLQIGVVTGNEDPAGEHRVRIRLPLISAEDDGIWARVASPDAGADRGLFIRPEIGDEVIAGFIDEDPRCPVILGMLHSSANAPPIAASDANPEKVYTSRAGMRLSFDDEKKVVRLDTPARNSITLSEEDQAITITDQNGNSIAMSADGITIESVKALTLKGGTEVTIESGTSLGVKGGTDLTLEGSSKAEFSSSGTTKIAGSMVQIN